MLKGIDSIEDKATRERALEALKAKDAEASEDFATKGDDSEMEKSVDDLDEYVKEYHEKNPELTEDEAYSKAVFTDKGMALYNKKYA